MTITVPEYVEILKALALEHETLIGRPVTRRQRITIIRLFRAFATSHPNLLGSASSSDFRHAFLLTTAGQKSLNKIDSAMAAALISELGEHINSQWVVSQQGEQVLNLVAEYLGVVR